MSGCIKSKAQLGNLGHRNGHQTWFCSESTQGEDCPNKKWSAALEALGHHSSALSLFHSFSVLHILTRKDHRHKGSFIDGLILCALLESSPLPPLGRQAHSWTPKTSASIPKPSISPVTFILHYNLHNKPNLNQISNNGHSRRAGFDAALIPGYSWTKFWFILSEGVLRGTKPPITRGCSHWGLLLMERRRNMAKGLFLCCRCQQTVISRCSNWILRQLFIMSGNCSAFLQNQSQIYKVKWKWMDALEENWSLSGHLLSLPYLPSLYPEYNKTVWNVFKNIYI